MSSSNIIEIQYQRELRIEFNLKKMIWTMKRDVENGEENDESFISSSFIYRMTIDDVFTRIFRDLRSIENYLFVFVIRCERTMKNKCLDIIEQNEEFHFSIH